MQTTRAFKMIFRTKLRYARINRRLSQQQLAELVGCSRINIVNIEALKNNKVPPINKVLKLAQALNVAPIWLLDDNLTIEDINIKDNQTKKKYTLNYYKAKQQNVLQPPKEVNPTFLALQHHVKIINNSLLTGSYVCKKTDEYLTTALLYTIKALEVLNLINKK